MSFIDWLKKPLFSVSVESPQITWGENNRMDGVIVFESPEEAQQHLTTIGYDHARNTPIGVVVDVYGNAVDMSRYREWLEQQKASEQPIKQKGRSGGRYGFMKKQMEEK